jgi:hypothetical protein
MSVPIPVEVFDESRLSAVGRTGLVGTGPDVAFDRLARAAASFCDAPLAFVTLVDDRVSWYVAAIGYPEDAERCGPVGESFCKLVIGSGERLVVGDTSNGVPAGPRGVPPPPGPLCALDLAHYDRSSALDLAQSPRCQWRRVLSTNGEAP